jgi:hypothetical protein
VERGRSYLLQKMKWMDKSPNVIQKAKVKLLVIKKVTKPGVIAIHADILIFVFSLNIIFPFGRGYYFWIPQMLILMDKIPRNVATVKLFSWTATVAAIIKKMLATKASLFIINTSFLLCFR